MHGPVLSNDYQLSITYDTAFMRCRESWPVGDYNHILGVVVMFVIIVAMSILLAMVLFLGHEPDSSFQGCSELNVVGHNHSLLIYLGAGRRLIIPIAVFNNRKPG